MITHKNGNMLNATENIICQQVNHQGVMGAGLAKQIATKYPKIVEEYRRFCKEHTFREIKEDMLVHFFCSEKTDETDEKIIANIFGQEYYGRNKRYTDYEALEHGLSVVCGVAIRDQLSVAIPHGIGCGLAGGDWNIVYEIIGRLWEYHDVSIYRL